MNAALARVSQTERLYGDTYVTWFASPEVTRGAEPGQFVMLRCAEPEPLGETPVSSLPVPDDPLLPRPMSLHRIREGSKGVEWSILYTVVGRGTRWLSSRRPGHLVSCWGPLGRGYSVRPTSHHLLLVGGGIGVAPLVWLADEAVAKGKSVTLILGGRTADQIFPASLLSPEVEVVVTTEDGSIGRRGLATEAFLEHVEWCDQAFACGPHVMYEAMATAMRGGRVRRPVQVLLEERMGCGTGICYGCSLQTRRGMRLVCKDGPRFDLREVFA